MPPKSGASKGARNASGSRKPLASKKAQLAAAGQKKYIPKAEYAAQQAAKRVQAAERSMGAAKQAANAVTVPKGSADKLSIRDKTHNEVHMRSKIAQEFDLELSHIKQKLNTFTFEGLDEFFAFVPISYVTVNLPEEIAAFRTYLTRFSRGSSNAVTTFIKWVEWGFFVAGKGHKFSGQQKNVSFHKGVGKGGEQNDEETADADNATIARQEGTAGTKRKLSAVRQTFADKVAERTHMRALLQMCQRHNSTKRREGIHALVNHMRARLPDDLSHCSTYQELKEEVDHTVAYGLSRLVLGMATENFAVVVLNCFAMYSVLKATSISARLVLSVIDEELSIGTRMKAMFARGEKDSSLLNDPDFDPDDIADPTRGERNQRVAAALFTLCAVIANHEAKITSLDEARRVTRYLCFCYVEHKGTRVLSGNAVLRVLRLYPQLLGDPATWEALSFAFFRFPKTDYLRPEGVQILLHIVREETQGKVINKKVDIFENAPLSVWKGADPLEPKSLEKLVNALFRREQVTACHPMVHPVWRDLLSMIRERCGAGESMRAHITNFIHNAITPYRRGNAEVPRKVLFSILTSEIGALALQHHDEADRHELVGLLSKTLGFGKIKAAKPTPIAELRRMSAETITSKVRSLLHHYKMIDDNELSASTTRAWVLKELRHCISVPMAEDVETPYMNEAAMALLEAGFFPASAQDTRSSNRCILLFADIFSFTFRKAGGKTRPKCTLTPVAVISAYLEAEEEGKTRYSTARENKIFRKARNKIVDALDHGHERSLLFYEPEDIRILLVLLFLTLSVDDPKNEAAESFATSVVPDLCAAFLKGDMTTIPVVLDVMMALCMRPNMPLHVLPLMTCARRIAIGYLTRFARFIDSPDTLEMVLGPLIEAFKTEERVMQREQAKKKMAKKTGKAIDDAEEEQDDSESSDDDQDAEGDDSSSMDDEDSSDTDEESADEDDVEDEEAESKGTASEDANESATDADSATDAEEDGNGDDEDDGASSESWAAEGLDEEADVELEDNEEEDRTNQEMDGFVEEEAATEQYLQTLKAMAGVDEIMEYPTDTDALEKGDVQRAITICWKVGVQLRTPLIVHVFQVLLAVMRNNVKSDDDVIFNSARTAVQCLMLSRNRYFGTFVDASELALLVDDIQSYCRKMEKTMVSRKDAHSHAKEGALIKHRMGQLKTIAVSVLAHVTFLAQKNGADDEVKSLLAQKFAAIFFSRGWRKNAVPELKRDMHHYRHAFAWCFLPAMVEKMESMRAVEDVMRAHTFRGCCEIIKGFLSRFKGLPVNLKESAAMAVRRFISMMPLVEIYGIKHTFMFEFFELIKICLKYDSKVALDRDVVSSLVTEVTDDDDMMVTKATIRQVASIERMLGMTPRIRNIKHPVSYQTIQKQHPTEWRKKKSAFYKRAAEKRDKLVKQVLSARNKEPTDFERAQKRRRREVLRGEDREERKKLREQHLRELTKDEKRERRKKMKAAKQERVAKNKQRKRLLHELRQRSFQKWREHKLEDAQDTVAKQPGESEDE